MKTRIQRPLKLLAALTATLLLGTVGLAALALQGRPLVPSAASVAPADVARAKRLLRMNDPRRARPGELHSLRLSEGELVLLLNHLGRHQLAERAPAMRLRLLTARAELQASFALSSWGWLNLQLGLREDGRQLAVDSLRLGRLPLPATLGQWMFAQGWHRYGQRGELQLARELVQQVSLQPGQLEVSYRWQADSYKRLLGSLLDAQEQARLRAHAELLERWTRDSARQGVAPLTELLPAAFALARQRSANGGDAAAENRAALVSLALYAVGRSPASLLSVAATRTQAHPLPLILQGRPDFPQHFIISAALAAAAGGPLADAIGVYKEQADALHGSGFSFNDLAADRAGARFGLLAMREPAQLQHRMAAGVREHELLPDLSDLPEYLSEAEFRRRYGGVDAPAYRHMMAAIEARLDGIALLR
ncbi:hypothetical protein [Roseateles sp.]|jgi:hypothetical protein|uniref:hypothetical protein n=1 Tax=Roseateles sp. TaxID=1971397 RepID=UPI0037C8642E